MITKNELMAQLMTKPFKRLLFTIFNTIEDDGFFAEAKCVNKKNYDMDDFEYIIVFTSNSSNLLLLLYDVSHRIKPSSEVIHNAN